MTTAHAANSPEVDRGLAWLNAQVTADGTVQGSTASIATSPQSATEVLHTLSLLGIAPVALSQRIAADPSDGTEDLARKSISLVKGGQPVAALITSLRARQNKDGGFGDRVGAQSNALDTAWVLLAFRVAGFNDSATLQKSLNYLISVARSDGGFSTPDPDAAVYTTSYALQALVSYRDVYALGSYITKSVNWLKASRGGSASHGESLYDALATIALASATTDSSQYAGLLAALKAAQREDGSWADDPYLTSLALRALAGQAEPPPTVSQGRATGRVLDAESRQPLGSALISVASLSSNSDATGRFETAGLNPGSYTLTVSKAGYGPTQAQVQIAAGAYADVGDILLALQPQSARVYGAVRDGDSGQPLAGAIVTISVGSTTLSATSAANGSFEIAAIPVGAGSVAVQKGGYRSVSANIQLAGNTSYSFSPAIYAESSPTPPETRATVSGRILAADTGAAVGGAQVNAGGKSATTAVDGTFAIQDIDPGSVTLAVQAGSYQPASFSGVLSAGLNRVGDLRIHPTPAQATALNLFGKVTNKATGAAVPGAVVRVQGSDFQAVTNAQGSYRIDGLPEKHLAVLVEAAGYYAGTYAVNATDFGNYEVNLPLSKAEDKGLRLSAASNLPSYAPFSDVQIQVSATNERSQARWVVLTARIYDSERRLLEMIPFKQLVLGQSPADAAYLMQGNASADFVAKWYNQSVPGEDYSIVVSATEVTGEMLAEASLSVSVQSSLGIGGGLTVDPPMTQAGSSEPVSLSALVGNRGNLDYPGGPLRLSVVLDRADPSIPTALPPMVEELHVGLPLNNPRGAQVDGLGNLYTVNTNNGVRSVVRIAPNGTVEPLAVLPTGHAPADLVRLSDGTLKVLSNTANIFTVTSSGLVPGFTPVTTATGGGYSGVSLTADAADNLYIVLNFGGSTNLLFRVTPSLQRTELLRNGLAGPSGIAVGLDGKFYVTNGDDDSIARIDTSGRIETFISTGLRRPLGIIREPSGAFVVADSGNNRLVRVGTDGAISVIATGIASPQAVARTSAGEFLVTSATNTNVVRVAANGQVSNVTYSFGQQPTAAEYDAQGRLYVTGSGGALRRRNADGTIQTLLTSQMSGSGKLVLGPDNALYGAAGTKVVRYDLASGAVTTAITGFTGGQGMDVAHDGSLLLAESTSQRIGRWTGGALSWSTKPLLADPLGFERAADDTWYLMQNTAILRLPAGGTPTQLVAQVSGGGVNIDMAVNPAGGLYVLNSSTKLMEVSEDGVVTQRATVPSSRRVTVGTDGSVYLASNTGAIYRLAPDNSLTTFCVLGSVSQDIVAHPAGGLLAAAQDGFFYRISQSGVATKSFSSVTMSRMSISADGTVHAVSSTQFVRISPTGVKTTLQSGLSSVQGFALYDDGSYDIAENSTDTLRRYDASNVLQYVRANFGSPLDVVQMGDDIVFSDSSYSRVYRLPPGEVIPRLMASVNVRQLRYSDGVLYGLNAAGRLVRIATDGAVTDHYADAELNSLRGFGVRAGNIAFVNQADNRVFEIAPNGSVLASYVDLLSISGIVVDSGDRAYVGTSKGPVRLSADGRIAELLTLNNGKSVALAQDGSLWASGSASVYRYNGSQFVSMATAANATAINAMLFEGGELYTVDAAVMRRRTGSNLAVFASGIRNVQSIRQGPNDTLYMVSDGGGQGLVTAYQDGRARNVASGMPGLLSVAVGDGSLYAGGSNVMYQIDIATGASTNMGITHLLADTNLQGLVVDPQNRVLLVSRSRSGAYSGTYRLTPSQAIQVPSPGTEVHSLSTSIGPIPVDGSPREISLGTWVPPYAGDYSLRLTGTGAAGQLVNTLHVGPHARGTVTSNRQVVPAGDTELRINVDVEGADFVTLSKADTSNLRNLFPATRPELMGADPAGNIYLADGTTVTRVRPDGTTETFFTASGFTLSSYGALPIDAQSNLYLGTSQKRLLRVRQDGTTEVMATLVANISSMVLDLQDNIVAVLANDETYRISQQGMITRLNSTGAYNNEAVTIDGLGNLYFFNNANTISKLDPTGKTSIVLTNVADFEYEGMPLVGDCADNLIVAPQTWLEMGQNGEEYTLVQINGKSGQAQKLFDGNSVSPKLDDIDFLVYDRFGQALLMWTDRSNRVSRMPISCGAISTDLHIVTPAGQTTTGFNIAPSAIADTADGGKEYVWQMKDVTALGRMVQFDTVLPDLALGEQRSVANEAFLMFRNSFTNSDIKMPLNVPKVNAGGVVTMTLGTDQQSYPANADVVVELMLHTGTMSMQGRVRIDMVDASGELVKPVLDEIQMVDAGNPLVLNPPLNTGSYQAGAYMLKATFTDEAGSLQAKAETGFGITETAGDPGQPSLKITPTTDKPVYGEYDAVQLLGRARSHATNFSHDNVTLRLTVLDPQGTLVYSETRVVAQLRPGAMVDLPGRYTLPGAALGAHVLRAEVLKADGSVLAEGTSAFDVRADDAAKLSGSVVAGSKSAYLGDAQTCRDTVINDGSRALNGLSLRRRMIELDGDRLISEELAQISVEAGASQVLNRSFSTTGYALANHACVLEAEVGGQWKTLGYDSFKVQDAPVTLAGTVVAAVDPVPQGETQTCRDTVRNTGPRPATGIPVRRVVLQLSPERRLREDTGSVSLPPNGEQTDTRVFGTEGFEQGPHACVLEARLNGQWQTLAYDNFNIDPPPVRVTATMERGKHGRLLVLMDGAPVNGSSKTEPAPQQQRQFLETLLTREGWSYTIVTDPEAFTWELRSGGYNVYALFSESAKLSERVQMELREAAYRGEGLLEAGSHDQRHHNFDDALGVKVQGKASQVTGVEVQATEPGPAGYADLALRDKPLKAQLNSASSLGRYLGSKGSDPSAVATRRYGKGRSVYLGYDLLAEATLAGSASLHAQLLVRSLAYVQPDYSQIAAGRVIPLRIRLENEAKPATGQLTLPMPSGATVVDKGQATLSNGVLTWAVDLVQDEDETYIVWVRLPDAGGPVNFTAQLKIGSNVHTTASLGLSPVASGGLTDALALARPITAFKQVTNWLDKADTALRAGDADTALSHLAKASDELLKVQHATAHDLRLMIDQALLDAGRRLWNG